MALNINFLYNFNGLEVIVENQDLSKDSHKLNTVEFPVNITDEYKNLLHKIVNNLMTNLEDLKSYPFDMELIKNVIKDKVNLYNNELKTLNDNFLSQIYFELGDFYYDYVTPIYYIDIFINYKNPYFKSGTNKLKCIIKNLEDEFHANSQVVNKWFNSMINKEIAETEQDIKNEKVFLNGATDETDYELHSENLRNLEQFLIVLKDSYKNS